MSPIFFRIVWFCVVAGILSYATYLVIGTLAHTQSSGKNLPVLFRDELGAGVHHVSGMIMVPTPCDQISVHTETISDTVFALVFRTWHEPSTECKGEEVPRYFRTAVFAPSTGVAFIATLDERAFPIVVLPVLPDRILFE